MYRVGIDIPAGEYKLFKTKKDQYSAFFEVYPESRQNDIIINGSFNTNSYVTVNAGNYLKLEHCSAQLIDIPKSSVSRTAQENIDNIDGHNEPPSPYKIFDDLIEYIDDFQRNLRLSEELLIEFPNYTPSVKMLVKGIKFVDPFVAFRNCRRKTITHFTAY